MKRYAVMACLLAAACGGAQEPAEGPAPQEGTGPMMGMGMMGGGPGAPPVYGLIGARERLALTSAQVTALDSIGAAVERENRELRRQLEDRGFRPGSRPTQAQMEAARPVLERMQENNRRAMEAVGELLSQEQRQGACAVQQEARESRAGRRDEGRGRMSGRGGARMGGRGGMMADSTMTGRARGWPWCPAPSREAPGR
ncbi:MAG TPA: hypothetical protein VFQ45_00900 [Longimicrobium sp.]|nr:hypothetical protein [Longimicrobium sp.]